MLFIEFQHFVTNTNNLIRYKEVHSEEWYYMYVDIDTLSILVANYGIISTRKIPTKVTNCDNYSTSREIKLLYHNAPISFYCGNNAPFYLPDIEENF